MLLGISDMTHI